jgi:hypothetical protein
VGRRLPGRVDRDAAIHQPLDELRSAQRPVVGQDRAQRDERALAELVVEAEREPAAAPRRREHGSQQPEHPADILRGDEVQRAAQRPGPDDAPLVVARALDVAAPQPAAARPQRQRGGDRVLRLHGAERPDELGGVGRARPGQTLRTQAQRERIRTLAARRPRHAGSSSGQRPCSS